MDLIPRLEITTLKGWDKLADTVTSQFFVAEPSGKADFDKVLNDVLKNAKTDEEKMAAIYNFTAQAIRSLPPAVSDIGRIPHPLNYEEILKDGYGDSRDKAALLSELLKKIGVVPQIILVAPVSNGTVSQEFPIPSSYTRAVVKVENNGKTYWFDPYVETCPFSYLPPEDQGRPGYALPTGNYLATPVYPPAANARSVNAVASIRPDGSLQETLELKARGADALGIRSVLKNIEDKERQQVLASLAYQVVSSAHPPTVQAVTVGSLQDLSEPVSLGLKFEAKNFATVAGDLTLFSMPIDVLDYLKPVLSQTSPRQYPFVLGNTVDQSEHFEMTIPPGYKLRTLPKGNKVVNAAGSYQASFSQVKNRLIFTSTLTLNKLEYDPKEFEGLKAMVADRARVMESKIVLEKSNSASKLRPKVSLAR